MSNIAPNGDGCQQSGNLLVDVQRRSVENEVKAEDCEIEEMDYAPLTHDENLKFELHRNNEVYKKNVKIGEQISILLQSDNIPEQSLSKQNKFCLDLLHARQPAINLEDINLRLWQKQFLDITKGNPMNDRKSI